MPPRTGMFAKALAVFSLARSGFSRARSGSTAITFAMSLPVMIGVGGFAADYSAAMNTQNRLQAVLDSTALSIAREMTINPVTQDRVQPLAEQYVAANIPANTPYTITVNATLVENKMAVQVEGQQRVATPFGLIERFAGVTIISGTALARVTTSAPTKLCILSLGEKFSGGVYMHNSAKISAAGCMFQSNSTAKDSVILDQASVVKANLICARGGVSNTGSTVVGAVVTDCPSISDPLYTKPEPLAPLLCLGNGKAIKNGHVTLDPGTYCGGLKISGSAIVTLRPGIYFFKDGPLEVLNNAELHGTGVTLMFQGSKSYFRFLDTSLIDLSAPTGGTTAGMLIWESTQFLPGLAAWWNGGCAGGGSTDDNINGLLCDATKILSWGKKINEHRINSTRARTLTGTIYLKRGMLLIDSSQPIADLSPYTLMVVQKLDLFDGPELVLNSNYAGSGVPVPTGLGPIGGGQLRLGM